MQRKEQIHTQLLHVRVSPNLRAQLTLAARKAECTISDWVRQQLRSALKEQNDKNTELIKGE